MTNRRTILRIAVCSLASAIVLARAQLSGKVPVVGLLMLTAGPNDPIVETLRRELDALGYVEGQNIRIEHRSAAGEVDRLPGLAQELVSWPWNTSCRRSSCRILRSGLAG
jgi:Fe2+ transport system protein FeoA